MILREMEEKNVQLSEQQLGAILERVNDIYGQMLDFLEDANQAHRDVR